MTQAVYGRVTDDRLTRVGGVFCSGRTKLGHPAFAQNRRQMNEIRSDARQSAFP